jgi:multidrug transporter EmrE-like cation transporter
MNVLNWSSLGFGLFLALIDVLAFPFVKSVSLGSNIYWMIVPVLLYAVNPIILLQSLKIENLAIMNLLWNTISTVLITIICICFFKEQISTIKMVGMVLSILSIGLMSYEG